MFLIKMYLKLLLLNFVTISISQEILEPTYTAAVVEYYPNQTKGLSPEELMGANSNEYLAFIDKIIKETPEVNIIVFPEATITANHGAWNRTALLNFTTEVLDPSVGISVCDAPEGTFSKPMIDMSCAARANKIYIVINLYEKENCTEQTNGQQCSPDKYNFYNTDVVFDKRGVIVARYRKWNLFGENLLNVTEKPEIITFQTDFNVTFGVFTCFDILFPQPAMELVRNGVRDFVFTSMWFSELPFLTATQVQQKWAYENNVTLLAAGALNTVYGSGGSGIYYRNLGLLNGTINGENMSQHFTATLPGRYKQATQNVTDIDRTAKLMDNFYLKLENFTDFTTELIKTNETDEMITELCTENKSLCCNFWIRVSAGEALDMNYTYKYRLVAFDGIKNFNYFYYGGSTICGIMACTNSSMESCGRRFPDYSNVEWPVTFEYISIEATYRNETTSIQFPNSLLSNIMPLSPSATQWSETGSSDEKTINKTYRLMEPQNRLLTFAIYGRDFSKDHGPPMKASPNGSTNANISVYMTVLFIFMLLLN